MRQHVKKLLSKIRQAAKEKRIAKFRKRFAEAYPDGEAFMRVLTKDGHVDDKDLFIGGCHLYVEGNLGAKGVVRFDYAFDGTTEQNFSEGNLSEKGVGDGAD